MFRRQFVQFITLFGAEGLATIAAADVAGMTTVTYRVRGFSCVTCAVGLDTTLRQKEGVVLSQASYPDGKVVVKFDPKETSDAALRATIAEMGFEVEP
jgi:Cu+-exporting ATPase